MNNCTIVIPSYWGSNEGETISTEKSVFDHPTDLREEGTLARLLDSLDIFDKFQGSVVIIAVANELEIANEVEDKIEKIIAPYRSRFEITCMGQNYLEKIKGSLAGKGVSEDALQLVRLDNYASVRNMCSLAGILNGSSRTVFIDDDEVFTDSGFLDKVEDGMGHSIDGDPVQALAGYYLQPDTYLLDETGVPGWRRPFWNNAAAMNEAFSLIIGRGERLKQTPFVFGGNMTLSLEALKKVPFDPRITRGEDMDFLLNLRINGIKFYLDRELSIKHLPPSSSQPDWKKLREDALRFFYERKKLNDHNELSREELQPYPGLFLGNDLEERILNTASRLKGVYESKDNKEEARKCQEIMHMANNNPFAGFDTKTWLQEITAKWQEITSRAEGLSV
jgi:hypothetical protein